MDKDQYFIVNVTDRDFEFVLDTMGMIWLIDNNNGRTNFGQEEKIYDIEKAKYAAKIMLYAMGKVAK
jgi:hypothetical protein